MRDRAELVERSLGGHRRRVDPLADERDVVRRPPNDAAVVQDDHRDVLGRRVDARTGRSASSTSR